MSSEPSTDSPRRVSVHERRLNQAQSRKPNKAQVRAAQTRAAQSAIVESDTETLETVTEVAAQPSARPKSQQRLTPAQRRAIERGATGRGSGMPTGVMALSRAQEMAFIREDLRRLIIIASSLLVLMIALLFVVD